MDLDKDQNLDFPSDNSPGGRKSESHQAAEDANYGGV